MGLEALCFVRIGRRRVEVKAHLDASELQLRGGIRLDVPFRKIRGVKARDGVLEVLHEDGKTVLELGDQAERWAAKITLPRSRIQKLGIKPGHRVGLVAVDDAALRDELAATGATIAGPRAIGLDVVFLGATHKADLAKLAAARRRIAPAGAIWVVWPKGRPELREDDVRRAAIAIDLVDVKVVAFTEALSGLRLVIPVAKR